MIDEPQITRWHFGRDFVLCREGACILLWPRGLDEGCCRFAYLGPLGAEVAQRDAEALIAERIHRGATSSVVLLLAHELAGRHNIPLINEMNADRKVSV